MKIYAICLVKNEDDVIGQSLTFAAQYCDKVIVIDNGSTDRTWEVVKDIAAAHPRVVPFLQTWERFHDGLRWLAYDAFRGELADDDWWLVLGADEFLAEDPRPIVRAALAEPADIVMAWQIQFYFTERDYDDWSAGRDDREQPIFSRRRHYRIDWQEPRLFRHRVGDAPNTAAIGRNLGLPRSWGGSGTPIRVGKMSRRRIFNRHYQYRDPPQIQKRLETRYGHPAFASQVDSPDWRSKLRGSKQLHRYREGEPWRFSFFGLAQCYTGRLHGAVRGRLMRARDRLVGGKWKRREAS